MIYKIGLMKDLPKIKAGAMWALYTEKYRGEVKIEGVDSINPIDERAFRYQCDQISFPFSVSCMKDLDDLENDGWISKEPFWSHLTDLRCPICGETRGQLMIWPFSYTDSDGDRCLAASARMEYSCGHTRMLQKGR